MTLTELKELRECCEDKKQFMNVINSIKEGYITINQFIDCEYITYRNDYFNSDQFAFVNGEVHDIDYCFWCPINEDYYHNDDAVSYYEGRNNDIIVSRQAVENNCEVIYFDGYYYDERAAEINEIVYIENLDEYGYSDNNYWHEDDGWYSYPDESRDYTRSYHNGGYRELSFGGKSKYKIGFEIEKEDIDVLESINIEDFERNTNYIWRKEEDSSLCGTSGFELISPTFEFNITQIFKHINSNPLLVEHINAGISKCCGGHINLSENNLSGKELFDKIKGYTPLFYSLYYGRIDKSYCKAKCNDDLKHDGVKYQAIMIHDNRVEFRIISAVPNVNTLKWRSRLIKMILKYQTDDIKTAFYHVQTKFTKLLSEQYKTEERMNQLTERFIKYSLEFENINLKEDNN